MNNLYMMEQKSDWDGRAILVGDDNWAAIYLLTQGVELLRTERTQDKGVERQLFVFDDSHGAAWAAYQVYELETPLANVHRVRRAQVAVKKALDGNMRAAVNMRAALQREVLGRAGQERTVRIHGSHE